MGNISRNSLKAWSKIKDHVQPKEAEVLNVLMTLNHPMGLYEVAERLNKYPNQISGRFTALKGKGLITVGGKGKTPLGYPCDLYMYSIPGIIYLSKEIAAKQTAEKREMEVACV
jgi:predicted transcriptional regulator